MPVDIFYQVAIIDAASRGVTVELEALLRESLVERGLDPARTLRFFLDAQAGSMQQDSPQITVYFGGPSYQPAYDATVAQIMAGGNAVIPVVATLADFPTQVPEPLRPVNAMAIPNGGDLAPLVALILESLRLLRNRRRLFLSYKRTEAANAATQLYHALDARSFDPFLDTHSIRAGDPFQERLWHRMADCDLLVLLHTSAVLSSGWVEQELGRASAMGITVLQVIWPGVERPPSTHLFEPLELKTDDFRSVANAPDGDPLLTDDAVERIANRIESLRARAIAAREARLLKLLCGLADERKITYVQRRAGTVDFCVSSDTFTRVCLGLGVPDGPAWHETVSPAPDPLPGRTWLMYDPLCIAPFHQKYLDWLIPMLPVGTLTPNTAEAWLTKLVCP